MTEWLPQINRAILSSNHGVGSAGRNRHRNGVEKNLPRIIHAGYADVSNCKNQRDAILQEEQRKKSRSATTMAWQRLVMKFRMLPRMLQLYILAILAFTAGLPIGYVTLSLWNAAPSLGTSTHMRLGKPYAFIISSTLRSNFNEKPRMLQLTYSHHYDQMFHLSVALPDQIASTYPQIDERYNPLPHDNPRLLPPDTMYHGNCQPLANWQESHYPTCNVIHEASSVWTDPHVILSHSQYHPTHLLEAEGDHLYYDSNGDDVAGEDDMMQDHTLEQEEIIRRRSRRNIWSNFRLVAGGAFRHVWMIREYDGTKRAMKTLRVDSSKRNFDLRSFDRHRRDAVTMERLTSSPLVANIYAFCTNTGLFRWGEGGDLESIFEREPNITKGKLLQIAYNVTLSISHAHNIDYLGRPTIAHTDIKPNQFLFEDGYYKLTDFNRVRFLLWNYQENKPCGFRVTKNGGIWRSPEEYEYKLETEKIDVFSLGNVLYFLLTGFYPWNDYSVAKDVYQEIIDGKRPSIPDEIVASHHPFDRYMIDAIEMCFTHSFLQRPSAAQVALKLQEGMDALSKGDILA